MTISRFLTLAALLVAAPALAESWRSYHNDRFGQSADYPTGWTKGEEPANNDGRIFTSPDGTARVTISGSRALDERTEEMKRAAEPLDGEDVTYSKKGKDWVVLSGMRNSDRIFYRKALLSCGGTVWNTVDIEYPAQDKAKYDKLTAHIAASLRAGEGYDITCD